MTMRAWLDELKRWILRIWAGAAACFLPLLLVGWASGRNWLLGAAFAMLLAYTLPFTLLLTSRLLRSR
ncbi:MAG: hypothetical protein Q9Q40_04840 [Acidobacteriota bacterium]|nr:hypothetical protein [Acidobacteriota bacterium]MDQ7087550.1 hypothetical protein [Acidobacteriota bacterium]